MTPRPSGHVHESAAARSRGGADAIPSGCGRRRGRHRAETSYRSPLRARRARFTTVWPTADAKPLPGTALLPGWLGHTIIALVAGYTQPGHRVLLLTPPRRPRAIPNRTAGVITGWFGVDEFAGLAEASWAVLRLGRGIDTATAAEPPDYSTDPSALGPISIGESGSGPEPTRSESARRINPDRPSHQGPPSDSISASQGFDLIITAAHPHAVDWLQKLDWARLLTPRGVLAAVTYSDIRAGRMIDPIATIPATLRDNGLTWTDHIVLLTGAAPADAVVNAGHTSSAAVGPVVSVGNSTPLPVTRTHHDLLLFHADALITSAGTSDAARDSVDQDEESSDD